VHFGAPATLIQHDGDSFVASLVNHAPLTTPLKPHLTPSLLGPRLPFPCTSSCSASFLPCLILIFGISFPAKDLTRLRYSYYYSCSLYSSLYLIPLIWQAPSPSLHLVSIASPRRSWRLAIGPLFHLRIFLRSSLRGQCLRQAQSRFIFDRSQFPSSE